MQDQKITTFLWFDTQAEDADGLMKLLQEPDPAKSARVMKAFMAMKKIDLAALERARKEA